MEKTTLKNLKHLVNIGAAELIGNEHQGQIIGRYDRVAVSRGIYGVNGLLIKYKGQLYAIIGRIPALFYYL